MDSQLIDKGFWEKPRHFCLGMCVCLYLPLLHYYLLIDLIIKKNNQLSSEINTTQYLNLNIFAVKILYRSVSYKII